MSDFEIFCLIITVSLAITAVLYYFAEDTDDDGKGGGISNTDMACHMASFTSGCGV